MSQSHLARRACVDHSYISRLESGSRAPTRDAVERIAAALDANPMQRDALLTGAGYLPHDMSHLFLDEPVVMHAAVVLSDDTISAKVRDALRVAIDSAVHVARASREPA